MNTETRTELLNLVQDYVITHFPDTNENTYATCVVETYEACLKGTIEDLREKSPDTDRYLQVLAELGYDTRSRGTIHLQFIGQHTAIKAADIRVGDTLAWNHGYTTEVISIDRETTKTIWTTQRSQNGSMHSRKFRKSRLVGFVEK